MSRNFANTGNINRNANINRNLNVNRNFNNNFNRFGGGFNRFGFGFYPFGFGFGFGYPWLWGGYGGWGGYGYGGYGYGGYGYGGYGYGGYGGYGNYGYSNYGNANTYAAVNPTDANLIAPADATQSAAEFIGRGEQAFQAGQYETAIRDWQHALVDNPNQGGVVLMMAQALFALGHYDEAAGAVQMGMQLLPDSDWGNVVKNYTQIYPNIGDYTNQLKALERARDAKTDSAPIRFLLGYHFGYLGYPKHAVRELDKALDLIPQDLGSQKLRDLFAVQAGLPARAHPAPPEQAPGAAPPGAPAPGTPAPPPVGSPS